MKKAVIFDMDGTILDTIEDLTDSLNHVMREYSFPEHTVSEVKSFVGNGIHRLIVRALPKDTDPVLIEEIYRSFSVYYRAHCQEKTRPYEGIRELLNKLKDSGIRTAVISNKADAAVGALCESMFQGCFDFYMGATDGVKLKPDREMVDIALEKLSVCSADSVYVGDSNVDIETAKNAELDCICVTWGFRTRQALIESGAEILCDTCDDLFSAVIS
ncbi:MAG: HAD-IA family hydrolase [Lachnospiraceae bacterium]|nr:HAD-IA family hydrolase [Lachnospiraceae bacterium]